MQPVLLTELAIVEPLRWAVRIAFALLTVAAVVQWARLRTAASAWLAATFGSVTATLVLGLLGLDPQASTFEFVLRRVQLLVIIAIPYSLYRFMRTFLPRRKVVAYLVNGLTLVAALALVLVPGDPSTDPDATTLERAAVFFVLAQFAGVSLAASLRLWWAGYDLPPVARGRMRTLGAAGVVLAAALLLAPFNAPGVGAAIQTGALLTAILFYAGFDPPHWLRGLWRGSITPIVRSAEARIATALTREEVGDAVTPLLREAFAARGAALLDSDGNVVARDGRESDPTAAHVLIEPVSGGRLVVEPSVFAPRYGEDEADLLDTFGTITSLALERADLFQQEREARRAIEVTHAELEALVFGLSHDLKNPIISLLGYAELLEDEYADQLGEEGGNFLDRMVVNATYMQQLLNDLLELSRVGRVETEAAPVDLAPVAEAVRDEVGRAHPDATIEVGGGLPTVEINPVRARQLLTNLVENAVRHGGRQDITVGIEAEGPVAGGSAVVLVRDDGDGIPEEHRERIFDIFERLGPSDASPGTGIGLAICRRIVESSGGSIRARASETGAIFELTLPTPGEDGGASDDQSDGPKARVRTGERT